MATKKRRPSDAVKNAQKRLQSASDDMRDAAQKRGIQVAKSIVDFQKNTMNAMFDGLHRAQDQAGKSLKNLAKRADWLPNEFRGVIDEWDSTNKSLLKDAKSGMSKSSDLVSTFLDRVEKEGPKKTKKKATKKKTAKTKSKAKPKKKAAKRKSAPKKKAASRKKPASAS